MRILVITPRFPFPLYGGDVIRIFHISQKLKRDGNIVDLLSFYEKTDSVECIKELKVQNIFDNVILIKRKVINSIIGMIRALFNGHPLQVGFYESREFKKELLDLYGAYDKIICHLVRLSPYLYNLNIKEKIILEMTDAISLNYERVLSNSNIFKYYLYKFEYLRLRRLEIKAIQNFSKTIVVSEIDNKYLNKNATVLKNGVSVEQFYVRDYKISNMNIIFIGNMRTNANQDMIFNFVRNIFPLVIKKVPGAKLLIVGAQPPKSVKNLEKKIKDVYVVGKVRSINDFYEKADVSICPMRVGAGIQNKILESMAHGVPVVTNRLGAENIIDIKNTNQAILKVSETDSEFADSICSFLTSSKLREEYGNNAKEFVENNFTWEAQLTNYIN